MHADAMADSILQDMGQATAPCYSRGIYNELLVGGCTLPILPELALDHHACFLRHGACKVKERSVPMI